ncbi:hypothetical protein ACHHYP_07776 [Achlya hypogyna]|uniref:Uncharacterized protein n=1 Tax=Achlya hypogyna TaxID=1202772 RepID=A0A1V9YQM5_ACHHY|nr:hypothetical protein ACHHYP_07776 [Achlya hypogyna]
MMQKQLESLGVDEAISDDLTRKETELQRDVTAAAHKRLNDIKLLHNTKQAALAAAEHNLCALQKDPSLAPTSSRQRSDEMDSTIVDLKDQMRRAHAYVRGLQHMSERSKMDGHEHLVHATELHRRQTTLAREWRALEARQHALSNLVATRERNADQLRQEQALAATRSAQTLSELRNKLEQSAVLERRRVEADKKRANLVRTFQSPLLNDTGTGHLTRTNTKMLLFREAILSTSEEQYDMLVTEAGEPDVIQLIERYVAFHSDYKALIQMDGESAAAVADLELRLARLEGELRDLQASGVEQAVETQRRAKARLEEELWEARVCEEKVDSTHTSLKQTLSVLRQGFVAITELVQCLDDGPVPAKQKHDDTLLELASKCADLVQRHLSHQQVLPTTTLQEFMEQFPPQPPRLPLDVEETSGDDETLPIPSKDRQQLAHAGIR